MFPNLRNTGRISDNIYLSSGQSLIKRKNTRRGREIGNALPIKVFFCKIKIKHQQRKYKMQIKCSTATFPYLDIQHYFF